MKLESETKHEIDLSEALEESLKELQETEKNVQIFYKYKSHMVLKH